MQSQENANPILVTTTRNGLVESVHRGAFVVVNARNEVLMSAGNTERRTFTRSAMKFIQVLPLIESGAADHYQLTPEEIAVICASHNAEEEHLRVVRGILQKADIPESALGCGAHRPFHAPAAEALLVAGIRPTVLHNNCSGKHSGFLLLAKFLGAPLETYLEHSHPVQELVRKAAAEIYELPETALHRGIDGCSAPNFALPLLHHAIGFKNLVATGGLSTARAAACKRVTDAVTQFPFMVAGTGRYCTDLMVAGEGNIIGKVGAEGVYALALIKEQIGIAIKIDDGAMGPQYNVAQAILEHLGALSPAAKAALDKYKVQEIRNFMKKLTGTKEGFAKGQVWEN